MINWHEVTPISRLLALILFLAIIPTIFFYLGMTYQDSIAAQQSLRAYDFPALQRYPAHKSWGMVAPSTVVEETVATSTARYTVEIL